MHLRNAPKSDDRVELSMTPLIDIVFLLLAFFVITFRIVSQEGDFNIKMPLAAPSEGGPPPTFPPFRVRLISDAQGNLAGIRLGENPITSMQLLHEEIIAMVGTDSGPGSMASEAEVELDADFELHYRHTVDAITAISGYATPDGQIVKLIQNLRFKPPEPRP